ncbi:MAG TPA: Rne/Rng family ribonuclease [Terriglobales bacterium]|nr:Rne/Rng family ribonuclease [Terriglobales bacterium]
MSKELVISATSHERRVAILEEGQLVEIYIEREKEFALVGSIYKGRVTRVLPGMQSAFVDIGLDGDAFLYVSDVFENLEDYDHGHAPANGEAPAGAPPIESLPGESLSRGRESAGGNGHPGDGLLEDTGPGAEERPNGEAHLEPHGSEDEQQPDSNESAPQNFSPQYNPTQYKPSPSFGPRGDRNDRGGQEFGRSDRGPDFRRGDRGGDRGRWGRRGGRGRGGRHHGQGGRNLPPSKYASPQGGERDQRGYENRPGQRGGFENRRPEAARYSPPPGSAGGTEEEILLPGESLAKYRGRPAAAPSEPIAEPERLEPQSDTEENQPRLAGVPASVSGPRRSRGGLPSWLLAGAGAEAAEAPSEEISAQSEEREGISEDEEIRSRILASHGQPEESGLSDDEASVLSASLIDAKQDDLREEAESDSEAGSGAIFEEEGDEQDSEEDREEEQSAEATVVEEVTDTAHRAVVEAEADAAHESAEHMAALGEHVELETGPAEDAEDENGEAEEEEEMEETEAEYASRQEPEVEHAAAQASESPASVEESILLPGETRSPHSGTEPRTEFRDSARIGGNPRARFQRPHRGGRDRGRDNRGGRPDRRGDRGGDRGRGRFERRGHSHGHHGHQRHQGFGGPRRPQLISEMLKAGQDVVVQIAKEPLGKKGARITSHIALPGRFLVYMPTIDHIGVSRKIASAENRSRLRRLVGEARGSYPGGFIVRTAAGGASDDEIRTDIEFLGKTWNEIKQKSEERKSPALLHRDLNLVERILRDYVSDDFTAIWIDNEEEYGKVVEFVSRFQPKLVNRVKLYAKEQPIFEEFGIQHDLDKALRAKVWLKSGGYIVINHTEALVAIDVNTGKFVGKGSTRLEDTIVKTNLEAVKEIVRQIRLRDLGGIIVVDFIDMEERRNREKVLSALQQALEQDKAPSKALSFNEFGLVCITRKRTKQALERVLCQPCPSCTGSGMVKSIPTLCYEIQNEARKMVMTDHENPNLTLRVHPEIAKALKTREAMLIDELEQNSHKHVIIQSDATLHWEQYDIY